MPRTSAAHATEMRQRILDGAYRAMLAGGYRGTTMPAIAAEADVSVGLLYRYFDSKEELYLAMCEGVTQAQLDELAAAAGTDRRSARAHGARRRPLRREPRGRTAGAPSSRPAGPRPTSARRCATSLRRRCDQIRAFAAMFLREAVARGEIAPDVDVEELSLAPRRCSWTVSSRTRPRWAIASTRPRRALGHRADRTDVAPNLSTRRL